MSKKHKTVDIDDLLRPDEDRYAAVTDENDRQAVALDIIKTLAEVGSMSDLSIEHSGNMFEAILRVAQTAAF